MAIVYVTAPPPVVEPGAGSIIDTAMILEHAFRRVKIHPSKQTAELVTIAKENLYLLLLNMANRGLNLWLVQSNLVGLESGRALYEMDSGTIDVLNVIYCQPTQATGTDTTLPTGMNTTFTTATSVRRVGVKFSSIDESGTMTIASTTDGSTWTSQVSQESALWEAGRWYWFELPIVEASLQYQLTFTTVCTVSEWYLASQITDLPVVQWNRDTWSVMNNKAQVGRPSTNYYLERLLTPQLTLWPVPNNNYDHLQVFVQRQVAGIGRLSEAIEVPYRWVEAIIWQLAMRLAYEVPQVDPALIPIVTQMADKVLIEVEHDESDGAPIMLQPNISVYNR